MNYSELLVIFKSFILSPKEGIIFVNFIDSISSKRYTLPERVPTMIALCFEHNIFENLSYF